MKKYIIIAFMLFAMSAKSQDMQLTNTKLNSVTELADFTKTLAADKGWVTLQKEMIRRGFKNLDIKEARWGFTTDMMWNGNPVKGRFFAQDMWNPADKNGQGATLIYKQVGTDVYKALVVFPSGEKDLQNALLKAEEWFVNATGNLEQAKSWSRKFRECVGGKPGTVMVDVKNQKFTVPSGCGSGCAASIAVCGGATAILATVTGGVTFPVAATVFAICAGVSCGVCIFGCAIGAM